MSDIRRHDVEFTAGGARCRGRLYLPAGAPGATPCVVMAHGTTGTMDFVVPAYAESFAAAGFATPGTGNIGC